MVREQYIEGLKEIERGAISIGEMVVTAIQDAINALMKHDSELAYEVVSNDININKKRWKVEEKSVLLIATQ